MYNVVEKLVDYKMQIHLVYSNAGLLVVLKTFVRNVLIRGSPITERMSAEVVPAARVWDSDWWDNSTEMKDSVVRNS